MKHSIFKDGFCYRLRPVELDDAQFIIDIRLEDSERNKHIHPISRDITLQEKWINEYFAREDDFYFVIENKLTSKPEGLVSLYNVEKTKAEWGRWIIKKGSLAAVESVSLIYRVAFENFNFEEVFSRTNAENEPVVRFHDVHGEKRRGLLEKFFDFNGRKIDAMEHYVDRELYQTTLKNSLEQKSYKIFMRNLSCIIGNINFHHIGAACVDINNDYESYKILGYFKESEVFTDSTQGIKGLFITADNLPRIELLQNLDNSKTLNYFIDKKIKMYHTAYTVADIEAAKNAFIKLGCRVVSDTKLSTYFKSGICFLVLPNMSMIELIEQN